MVAQKKGGWIGRLIVRKAFSEMELTYFPFYKVTLEIGLEARKFPFAPKTKFNSQINVLVSGTTGQASIIDKFPRLEKINEENSPTVDPSIPEEKIVESATKCANKFVVRRARAVPAIRGVQSELVFRPYWVAFYGERVEGSKIHYLPIQADGFNVATAT
ncbi:hypothetical protein DCMF_18650 [Candidatus Formimonas warabiya]|uniref:Uncharacterized protein n=1 Tax=Formimonas warabiya TaxID=1761012 RepID=A0A3G1KVP7_FORW1|nr:hypothetical protein DCMF_18650 [Candidatus Formimonas warabiya]